MNSIRKVIKETDWVFLLFLLIFLNQSNYSLKVVGIAFIYIIRPNFEFGFWKNRIPKFYLLMIFLALINFIINIRDFSKSYLIAFGIACLLWSFSFLAYHQLKLSVEKYGEKHYSTLKVFMILHFVFSIVQLIKLMAITHHLNPYSFEIPFPYGLSAGDNIFGIYWAGCYYNVMTCSFLAIYFLYKRNIFFSFLAVFCLVIVFANTGTLLFMAIMAVIFFTGVISMFFKNDQQVSSVALWINKIKPPGNFYFTIPCIFIFIFVISYLISPENFKYTTQSLISKIHQGVSKTEMKKLNNLEEEAATDKKTIVKDTVVYRKFVNEKEKLTEEYILKFKGKKLSLIETNQYLVSSPRALLFGAGPVRFSSLTAQKMAGYDSSRIFRKMLPGFSSQEYDENHRLIIKARVESQNEYWSAINFPDTLYNQILGEYGVIGALIFLIYYIGYFLRRFKYWTYGLWLSVLFIPFSFLCYPFEAFSYIIIYEFLMEIDTIKYGSKDRSDIGNSANAGI